MGGRGSPDNIGTLIFWGIVLLILIVALVFAVIYARRKLRPETTGMRGSVWDLQTLREMHERGELSDAEYRALRASAVQALTGGDR